MNVSSILVVDDDDLFQSSIQTLIEEETDLRVVATAANGLEALELIREHSLDLVLLDIQMPEMNGIECIRHIRSWNRELPLLILTTFEEQEYIVQGLAHGANGYLVKGMDPDLLIKSIRDAIQRHFVLTEPIAAKLSSYLLQQQKSEPVFADSPQIPTHMFTKREQEIIQHLIHFDSNQDIAEKCVIAQGTLRNHLLKIYAKLNVDNRLDAIHALQQLARNS